MRHTDYSAGSDVRQESQAAVDLRFAIAIPQHSGAYRFEDRALMRHRGICERAVAIRGARRRLLRAHRPAAMMTALCQDSYTRAGQTQLLPPLEPQRAPPALPPAARARGPHSVTVPHHRTAQREAIRSDPRFTDAVEPQVYQ